MVEAAEGVVTTAESQDIYRAIAQRLGSRAAAEAEVVVVAVVVTVVATMAICQGIAPILEIKAAAEEEAEVMVDVFVITVINQVIYHATVPLLGEIAEWAAMTPVGEGVVITVESQDTFLAIARRPGKRWAAEVAAEAVAAERIVITAATMATCQEIAQSPARNDNNQHKQLLHWQPDDLYLRYVQTCERLAWPRLYEKLYVM